MRRLLPPWSRYVYACSGITESLTLGTIGDQRDTLVPKLVPAFSNDREVSRAASVFAGPTCSAVIDKGGMYWLAGKVSTSFGLAVPDHRCPDSDMTRNLSGKSLATVQPANRGLALDTSQILWA
jgi:hypothetical protein